MEGKSSDVPRKEDNQLAEASRTMCQNLADICAPHQAAGSSGRNYYHLGPSHGEIKKLMGRASSDRHLAGEPTKQLGQTTEGAACLSICIEKDSEKLTEQSISKEKHLTPPEKKQNLKDLAEMMTNFVIDKSEKVPTVSPSTKTLVQTIMADNRLLPMQRGADLLPENRQLGFPPNIGPISGAINRSIALQRLMPGPSEPNSTSLTRFMGLKHNDQNSTKAEQCEEPKEEITNIVPSEDLDNI